MKMVVGPLVISAAHFIHTCVKDSPCQRMHGHNYIVNVEVFGDISEESCMLLDANIVKQIVDEYDHKTIVAKCCIRSLPDFMPNNCELYEIINPTTGKLYYIPKDDCCVIDIPSTSAEWMAKAISTAIVKLGSNIRSVHVNIAETPKLNVTATFNSFRTACELAACDTGNCTIDV